MTENPELDAFRRRTQEVLQRAPLKQHRGEGVLRLGELGLEEINSLLKVDEGYYLLLAAAKLTRTTLKKAQAAPEVQVMPRHLRRAHVFKERLPAEMSAEGLLDRSVTLRARDLGRKRRGKLETMFRVRLREEGIPIFMSPPVRKVPGLLISVRKPDGVAPDPDTGDPPAVYLEIKNIRRVSDDIQKRLYEIAEVSLEMKLLYGGLRLSGVKLERTADLAQQAPKLRKRIRSQIRRARPVVVAFVMCPREEAERYRPGAEAFIDALFFQEEVEECLDFLRSVLQ